MNYQYLCVHRAILKENVPGGILEFVGMLVFVLPRRVNEFQTVAIADLKGRRGPKTGCGVGPNGGIVDQHLQEGAIPSVAVAVVHGQAVCAALGLGVGACEEEQEKERKCKSYFFHRADTLFGVLVDGLARRGSCGADKHAFLRS